MKSDAPQKIELYLRGLLSEAESHEIERQLAEDPALRQELRLLQAEMEIMQRVTAVRVAERIKRWRREKKKRERLLWLALSLALAIGAFFWLFPAKAPYPAPSQAAPSAPAMPDTTLPRQAPAAPSEGAPLRRATPKAKAMPKPEIVAKALKMADPPAFRRKMLAGERVAEKRDSLLAEAEKAWLRANFAQTLACLEALEKFFPEYSARWAGLRGTILLQTGQAAAAADALEKAVARTGDGEQSEWNLLLACFAAGSARRADFERLLAKIMADPSHPAHQKVLSVGF